MFLLILVILFFITFSIGGACLYDHFTKEATVLQEKILCLETTLIMKESDHKNYFKKVKEDVLQNTHDMSDMEIRFMRFKEEIDLHKKKNTKKNK